MADSVADVSDLEEMVRHLHSLWRGKWIVFVSTIAGVLIGLSIHFFVSTNYTLSVPYYVNFYPHDIQKQCGGNIACRSSIISAMLLSDGKDGWSVRSKNQVLLKSSNEKITNTESVQELELKSQHVNDIMLQDAISEIGFLNQDLPAELEATESFAGTLLSALRIRNKLETEGLSAISFGNPTIRRSLPSQWIIAIVLGLFGLIAGVILVFAKEFLAVILLAWRSRVAAD